MTEYRDELIVLTRNDGTEWIVARAEVDPDISQTVAGLMVVEPSASDPRNALFDLMGRTSLSYALYVAEEAAKLLAVYWLIEGSTALMPAAAKKFASFTLTYRAIKHQFETPYVPPRESDDGQAG